jgi:hypothetical protein
MRNKIIGIFVCMLLISACEIVLADWEPGDGHKMHFPQLPNPEGFDVDFGFGPIGDDWQCSETGTVDDIHFWISWFWDDPLPIQEISVSIWSNNPVGPHGWSEPLEMLWERVFYPGEFIEAGPWPGNQLWLLPWGEIIPQPHGLYWQINIPEIEDPFIQDEGEIYWLIIHIPYFDEMTVGWKTSLDWFMDHAVWFNGVEWMMIDGYDLAFVITGEQIPPPEPDLDCDGDLSWTGVKPGSTVYGSITVENIGEPGSLLNWEISKWPIWGTWTFNPQDGINLTSGDSTTVNVTVVAPTIKSIALYRGEIGTLDEEYTGIVKIIDKDNNSDFCEIDVYMKTPRNTAFNFYLLLVRFLENHPFLFPVLRNILGL